MQGTWGRARIALALVAGWLLWSAAPAVASTYTVMNTADSGTGSLRAAITQANSDSTPPATIIFGPGASGVLDVFSPLAITRSVNIDGPGASTLELDGQGGTIQIMTVSSGSTVSISGLRLAYGYAATDGGAIDNSGTMSVSNSEFDHNSAGGPGGSGTASGEGSGGAIYNSGTLTVSDSTFSDNSAGGVGGGGLVSGAGEGGAIFGAASAPVTVSGSTFTANSAGGNGAGGIDSGDGSGGAIAVGNNGSLTLLDSTLTRNIAGGAAGAGGESGLGDGAALFSGTGATTTLSADTIDANSVGAATGSVGAGIANLGTMSINGTIVSGNSGATNCDSTGTMSAHDSLEGPAGQTSCGFDLTSADPQLAALADNGGPTETQALGVGSPAIGAVTVGGACPATDQRGALRPQAGCDVGAYEVAPPVVAGTAASGVGTTSASLSGTVSNPDVFAGTVSFQYGTSTAYGTTATSQALPASSSAGAYGASLTGLAPGTTYHFRVVATNPDGTVYGPDEVFATTSPPPPPPPPPSSASSSPSNVFTFGKASVAPGGKITLPVNAPDAGRFTGKATFEVRRTVITHKHGKRVVKHVTTTFTYGTASVASSGKGTFKLLIGLSPKAAHELKLLGRRQVTIAVTFTPTGGSPRRKPKKLTIKRSRKGKYS